MYLSSYYWEINYPYLRRKGVIDYQDGKLKIYFYGVLGGLPIKTEEMYFVVGLLGEVLSFLFRKQNITRLQVKLITHKFHKKL